MLQILPGFLISLAIALLIGPSWIKFMARVKAGQTIRSEGPESHLKKMGTPMMGGFIFLISTTIVSVFYVRSYPKVIPVLSATKVSILLIPCKACFHALV